MAKTLTLRNVPDRVVAALNERARRNERSAQRELLAILEAATLDRESLLDQLQACRASLRRPLSIQQIQAAIEEGRP